MAEICFHWSQFAPMPSKPAMLHRLRAKTKKTLRLLRADLEKLEVDWRRDGEINYTRTQEIGAAIAFLDCDGLIAPCARWDCDNLMLFLDNHQIDDGELEVVDAEEIDWHTWGKEHQVFGMPNAIRE